MGGVEGEDGGVICGIHAKFGNYYKMKSHGLKKFSLGWTYDRFP